MSAFRLNKLILPSLAMAMATSMVTAYAADRVAIVSEGAASREWTAVPGLRMIPAQPAVSGVTSQDVCVTVGYMINKDGSTSDFTLLKSWSAEAGDAKSDSRMDPFAQSAVATVSEWRFVPAQGRPGALKPIYTAASMGFPASASSDREQVRKHCAIQNLPAFVAKAQAEAYKRGNLNKGQLDRNQTQYPPTINGR